MGGIDIFTIVFAVIAVVIVIKLRSTLGRRGGDDEARIERHRIRERETAAAAAARDKVVQLPRREPVGGPVPAPVVDNTAEVEARLRATAGEDTALGNGLVEVWRADRSFEPESFLRGARQAYEMIVTAFAEGNRKLLRDLLTKEVFDSFVAAVGEREARGEQIEQSFVGISKAAIVEAELKGALVHVTVKFVSELISATRDKAGAVIGGDPKQIREVTDIWTFARETSSRNPNWKLIATQPAN